MIGALTRPGPPAWQTCEVCRAARALQLATDALLTFGGDNPLHLRAVKVAADAWDYAKGGRHTGAPHAPMVVA